MWRLVFIFYLFRGVYSNSSQYSSLELSQLERNNDVKYLTFTKDDRKTSKDIRDVNFNDGQVTVFIVHGYLMTSLKEPLTLKDDILKYNQNVARVIVVSWMNYSRISVEAEYDPSNYYKVATQHVPSLARDLSEKLNYIRRNGAQSIELIGHCIGAHVAGQAGKLYKDNVGESIDTITGLDPAGLYFQSEPDEALQQGISEKLMIFHTNMNRYGFPSTIGQNDTIVNGGKKQPNCKNKLTEDICSHNEAWKVYSKYVKDNGISLDEMMESRPYVLCVDISESMRNSKRLTIATDAASQLITNMADGTYVGIVTFNHDAVATHDIVQIKGEAQKTSLVSSLPKIAKGSTSIGAGLRRSMELVKGSKILQSMLSGDDFCSTIILISDGEQTAGETPNDVLPEIENACITVNSIGLGADASQDLEDISGKTAGQVFYVPEVGASNQMADTIRALLYSYESELDADDRSIYLPSKEIEITNEDTVLPFDIDENIGKDTEIDLISDDLEDIDMTLTSPNGQEYSSESPEFSSSLMKNFFALGLAEPGQYNLTVKKNTKSRRAVRGTTNGIVMVKTHEIDKTRPAVRLDATVSNRTIKYPQSITISAEVRSGKFPVINADVYAHIKGVNLEPIRFKLADDGTFPDNIANDGIYTANIIKLPKPERYSVTVTASSNGTATLVTEEINYFLRRNIDCRRRGRRPTCRRLRPFQRETVVGSIKLLSSEGEDKIPPSAVLDLSATVPRDDQKLVILQWTSPVKETFNMKLKRYDIRLMIGDFKFEDSFQIDDRHLARGTLDARNSTDGKIERIFIEIPDELWDQGQVNNENNSLELKFALKAVGINEIKSELSNVAVAIFKQQPPRRQPIISNQCSTVIRRTSVGVFKIKLC